MSVRNHHVSADRLTALAFGARGPQADHDPEALAHIAGCDRCADELVRRTADADELRTAACAHVDAIFDEAALETQRTRILDRLAHLGQAARVLRFPLRHRADGLPTGSGSRRWISVAAAAGLIIGLVAGQLLNVVPWRRGPEFAAAVQPGVRQSSPAALPATVNASALSDDELLDAIEAAVQLRRATSLRALDAITPIASDLADLSRGR
jgi:hypothetical protein